jgi:hypothetical protein
MPLIYVPRTSPECQDSGLRAIDELEKNLRWLDLSIPDDLWAELKHEGLLREDAPTPSSAKIESGRQ